MDSGFRGGTEPVPFMENARTGTLSSGIRYYLLDNPRPEGRAFLSLVVDAGSILETEEERGLAHFVEHMAFNGTARFPGQDLINYLRTLGMRFGPEVNARTSFDYTIYDLEVPVEIGAGGERRIPERALAVIDDWTWSLVFDADDFENERLVILEEYRFRMGAQERVNRQLFPVLFRDSRYAERLPIGTLEVLENAPVERLIEFYEKWYRPENMAIIIVGDFDVDLLEAELENHFPVHRIWERDFTRPRYDLRLPVSGSLETLVITDHELTQSSVELFWQRNPEIARADLSAYRELLIGNLIGSMISMRFQEEMLKEETPYAWAGAGSFNYAYSSGFYYLSAMPRTGAVTETLEELLLTKESLYRYGFLQEEVNEAKAYIISNLERMVAEEGRHQSSGFIRSFTQHFLNNAPAADYSWELNTVRNMLPGISLEEINATVRSYFAEDDLTIIITATESERSLLPDDSQIRAMVYEAGMAYITPPAREALTGEILDHIPSRGSIVTESIDSETGALRWVLSNGAEVILFETNNTNNQISLYASARGGTLSVSEESSVSALLAADMLNYSGLGSFSRTELMRLLIDKQVSLSFWAMGYERGFRGSTSVQDQQTLFEMLYVNFTRPRFENETINVLLNQYRSSLREEENDPAYVLYREVQRSISGNPRHHAVSAEDLDRVNIDDAMAFILRSLNPADYVFVFTGIIDPVIMRPLVENYIASIPAYEPGREFNTRAVPDPRRPQFLESEIYFGMDNRSIVELNWFIPMTFSEEAHANTSVLNDYLGIRLNDRIREDLGGVYAIGSWFYVSPQSGELSGRVVFYCDPARVDELIEAVIYELEDIAAGNIDPIVFNQAVEAVLRGYEDLLQRDNTIAESFANSVMIFDSPLARLYNRPRYFGAVREEGLVEIMTHILNGNYIRVVLYPEVN